MGRKLERVSARSPTQEPGAGTQQAQRKGTAHSLQSHIGSIHHANLTTRSMMNYATHRTFPARVWLCLWPVMHLPLIAWLFGSIWSCSSKDHRQGRLAATNRCFSQLGDWQAQHQVAGRLGMVRTPFPDHRPCCCVLTQGQGGGVFRGPHSGRHQPHAGQFHSHNLVASWRLFCQHQYPGAEIPSKGFGKTQHSFQTGAKSW